MNQPRHPRPWRPTWLLGISLAVHLGAVAAVVWRPGLWPWLGAGVFADHVLLMSFGLRPRSRQLGPNLTHLSQLVGGSSQGSSVALTFDDGPDPEVTPQVLDQLDRCGAQASFFLIGRRAQKHPELVAEIVRRGHRVENHTHHHSPLFACYPPWALAKEIDRTQATLTRLAGRPPLYFRAPAGIRSPFLEPILARRGLHLASWTRRGYDAVARDPAPVVRRILRNLGPGDILVFHDGTGHRGPDGEPLVLTALAEVLDELERARLQGCALPIEIGRFQHDPGRGTPGGQGAQQQAPG